MDKYIVVDVETANANLGSICQIGIAVFENNELVETWETLINPKATFDQFNSYIHGISDLDVISSPTIKDIENKIISYFRENIVFSYSLFDKNAFSHHINVENIEWLDITRIVRRVWTEFSKSGYGLANVCKKKGITFNKHHDALSDAIGAGSILSEILKKDGFTLERLKDLATAKQPYNNTKISFDPNIEGEWFGEVLVFTGALGIPRKNAEKIAADAGFKIGANITKETTFLVKGYQDISVLNGKKVSSKEQKALDLILKGQDINFISESDFFNLIKS